MAVMCLVAGARPNFMKIAPIVRAVRAHGGLGCKIIDTGQHCHREMNEVFFEELCRAKKPDTVPVVGDINSTLDCSIVAKKRHMRGEGKPGRRPQLWDGRAERIVPIQACELA